jgi:alpha-L-rhamnosidase
MQRKRFIRLAFVATFISVNSFLGEAALEAGSIQPVDLRCEYLVDPLGIDVVKPRLSWLLEAEARARKQTFYQVLVASDLSALGSLEADLWNSGKVKSDQTIHVEYAGKPLTSRMRCYWKVRVWDNEEAASGWSRPAHWSMGLLEPGDWKASWIGLGGKVKPTLRQRLPARMLRREFDVRKKILRATAYVCGLGLFELYVNGQKVGDHLRDPSLTAYERRCLYVTFDLTDRVQQGKNAFGVILGNGRFFAPILGDIRTYGLPRLRMQVHIDHGDGTSSVLVSNKSWKVTDDGPIRANSEFDGEEYDARKEQGGWDQPGFDDSTWRHVQRMPSPGVDLIEGEEYHARKAEEGWDEPRIRPNGDMVAQVMEPMRVTGTVRPIGISEPKPGVYVLDMGQAFYGTLQLKVSGPSGTQVKMVSAYSLRPDGTLKTEDNRDALSTDIYILKGQGEETWTPRFKGQGFRRVEITGFPGVPTLDNFEGQVVHSDFEAVGSFNCSNGQVNQLYQNVRWTQRSARRGLPHGEADRDERCGWLADVSTASESDAHNWNVAAFYTKFLEDIRLDQKPDGHLPDSVAVMWGYHYRGSLVWNRAAMMIPEFLYNFYGDRRILEEQYDCMKKWMLFVGQYQKRGRDKSKDPKGYYYFESDYDKDDYTINHNNYGSFADTTTMDGGSILGATNRPLLSTAFHYNHCRIMARVARLLDRKDDAAYFSDLKRKTAEGFHNRFFDPETNSYASQTQLSYLLPLVFDMVPEQYREAVIKNFVDDTMIKHDAHVTYGELGTQFVMPALTKIGHPEAGYALTQQTTRPSWGYMIAKGATTIWERWDGDTAGPGMNSEVMLALGGNLNAWMYQTLGGINYDPEQPGFKHIILHPRPVGDLTFVQASLKSIRGQIVSNWKIEGDAFDWEVAVPPNTTATVHVPARADGRVTESGQEAGKAAGVRFLRRTKQSLVFSVGSGNYRFVSR